MKISTGNFGNTVARPSPGVEAPAGAFGAGVSQALGQAGRGLAETAEGIMETRRRADAAVTLAQLDNEVRDLHDTIGRQVDAGEIAPGEAISTYRTRVGELQGQRLANLDVETRRLIEANVLRTAGAGERSLQGVVVKRQQSEIGASLGQLGEQFQRSAMRDLPGSIAQYDGAVDALGPQAGWSPEQMQQAKQAFREGATYNFANATLEGAAQTGNADLIRAAMEKIGGPDGESIDPARRTALITKGYGYLNGIQAAAVRAQEKAEREQKAREDKAKDVFNSTFQLLTEGRFLSTDYISTAADTVAGTSMAEPFQKLVQQQADDAMFATKPLPQQAALLEQMRARGSTRGVGTDPASQKEYERLDRIYTASVAAYKENPWQAAQERGVIERAPLITLSSVQDAQSIIGQRMQEIGQVEVAAGEKISPLQPEEAQTVGRIVRALPPDQQSSALASFGALIGDADRVAALARQISEKDKTLGIAMAYANSKTTAGRYTSELILRGERAIRDKVIKPEDTRETGWRAEIVREIGDATLNEQVRQQWIDAAFNIQAAIAAEGGGTDIRRAVNLATGGLREQRDGTKIPCPYGMSDDTFTQRIGTLTAADFAEQVPGGTVRVGVTAMPLDQFVRRLPQASLVHAGQGKYAVRAGTGFVTNDAGQRIIIDLNPRRPVASPPPAEQGMPKGGR